MPDYEVPLKEEDYTKGRGPWWIDLNYSSFKHSPADGKDAQLNKAIEVLQVEMAKSGLNTTASAAQSLRN